MRAMWTATKNRIIDRRALNVASLSNQPTESTNHIYRFVRDTYSISSNVLIYIYLSFFLRVINFYFSSCNVAIRFHANRFRRLYIFIYIYLSRH